MKKYLFLFFVYLSVQLQAQLIGYDVAFKYAPVKISDSIQSFLIMKRSINKQFRNYNEVALLDYYNKHLNDNLNRSIKYVDKGEWEKALKNWLIYSNYGSRRTKSKIMLNIQQPTRWDQANEWAKKSLVCYERERTQNYLNVLLTQYNTLYAGK